MTFTVAPVVASPVTAPVAVAALPALLRRHSATVLVATHHRGGLLHAVAACPAAGHSDSAQVTLAEYLTTAHCPLCAPRRSTVAVEGPEPAASLARVELAFGELALWLRRAPGDPVALANAGVVFAGAQAALAGLYHSGAPVQTCDSYDQALQRTATVLDSLRAASRSDLHLEVYRRWLVGPDGDEDRSGAAAALPVWLWRALRWVVRNGGDPALVATEADRPAVVAYLGELASAARAAGACHADRMVAVACAAAHQTGARPTLLAALGFSVSGNPGAQAGMLPGCVAASVVPGFPGALVVDAGPPPPCSAGNDALASTFVRLWAPGTPGPLGDPAQALAAAAAVLDAAPSAVTTC